MEPNQQVDGNQTKIDYPHNMEFQQQNSQAETISKSHALKPDNAESKSFPQTPNGPETMQQRSFGPGYGDSSMQRSSMFGEGMMSQSVEQPHYPPGGSMSATNSTSLAANTPTLNQLLTQNPTSAKYPPGYADYSNTNSAPPGPGGPPNMYDGWNSTQQQSSMSSSPARPGMPPPNRSMSNNSPQVSSMSI